MKTPMSDELAIIRDEQETLGAEWANGVQCVGIRLGMADWLAEEALALAPNSGGGKDTVKDAIGELWIASERYKLCDGCGCYFRSDKKFESCELCTRRSLGDE